MAAKDHTSRSRFAVACGVLSRCVRAEAGLTAAAHAQARPATTATATATTSTMLLMPGADVTAPGPGVIGEEAAAATPSQAAQLKIVYGGRVMVFDDVPADRAAELLRLAAAARPDVPGRSGMADTPVARKASLQRFMEKRRDRLTAQAPYGSASRPAVASKGRQQEGDAGACWLGLGIPGGHVR